MYNDDDFVCDYYYAGTQFEDFPNIDEFLGKSDASEEWEDQVSANANFINTTSYDSFASPSCKILVGRIGSGKTSMFNKLKYSIENGNNPDYQHVISINTFSCIANLSTQIRILEGSNDYSSMEITNHANSEWDSLFKILLMRMLYNKYSQSNQSKIHYISTYLKRIGYISEGISMQTLVDMFASTLLQSEKLTSRIAGVFIKYTNEEKNLYYNACEEARSLLEDEGNVLILIDSLEKYEYKDPIVLNVIDSLVNICLTYSSSMANKVYLKVAIPSELMPKLISINPTKITSKTTYIRWSCSDLKRLIAVRIFRYKMGLSGNVEIDINKALDYFEENYNSDCNTRCNIRFPSFSYCLSHTLKGPRQVLSIFNTWMYLESKNKKYSLDEIVEKAISQDITTRLKGALSIYTYENSEIYEMFCRTFTNQKYCFSQQEFDGWLNECSNIRGELDAYDLKKLFISSGLVGVMINMHPIPLNHPRFKNTRDIRIKEVVFEYQRKESIHFNNTTRFCLHPMVYAALNIKVDRNTFVYPQPFEDEYNPWE